MVRQIVFRIDTCTRMLVYGASLYLCATCTYCTYIHVVAYGFLLLLLLLFDWLVGSLGRGRQRIDGLKIYTRDLPLLSGLARAHDTQHARAINYCKNEQDRHIFYFMSNTLLHC